MAAPVAHSVLYLKRWAILRPGLPPIIEPRRSDVGMPKPLLHLGNVCFVIERISHGRGSQRMRPETFDIAGTDHARVVAHHPLNTIGS
jgi:hypothetical protein